MKTMEALLEEKEKDIAKKGDWLQVHFFLVSSEVSDAIIYEYRIYMDT